MELGGGAPIEELAHQTPVSSKPMVTVVIIVKLSHKRIKEQSQGYRNPMTYDQIVEVGKKLG